MHPIERKIAGFSGKADFIASGGCGRVFAHGDNRVYKEAVADGTGVWLERCLAIQKRLGINHPLCKFMPEVFSFQWSKDRSRYKALMRRYTRIHDGDEVDGMTYNSIPTWTTEIQKAAEAVIGEGNAGDLHGGNILWCTRDKRWVLIDPSFASVSSCGPQDPKFNRAKRVVTQYGPPRRQ